MFLLGLIKKTTQINIIHQTNLNEIYCSDAIFLRALASSGGRTHHIGRQVHDSDRITFEVMTFILNLHRPALKAYQCAYKKPLRN
jgi:hypothetical protein